MEGIRGDKTPEVRCEVVEDTEAEMGDGKQVPG